MAERKEVKTGETPLNTHSLTEDMFLESKFFDSHERLTDNHTLVVLDVTGEGYLDFMMVTMTGFELVRISFIIDGDSATIPWAASPYDMELNGPTDPKRLQDLGGKSGLFKLISEIETNQENRRVYMIEFKGRIPFRQSLNLSIGNISGSTQYVNVAGILRYTSDTKQVTPWLTIESI